MFIILRKTETFYTSLYHVQHNSIFVLKILIFFLRDRFDVDNNTGLRDLHAKQKGLHFRYWLAQMTDQSTFDAYWLVPSVVFDHFLCFTTTKSMGILLCDCLHWDLEQCSDNKHAVYISAYVLFLVLFKLCIRIHKYLHTHPFSRSITTAWFFPYLIFQNE